VCNTCKEALDKGIFISAAAGNISGKTACPAKLSLYGYKGIVAVGALNPQTSKIANYSGKATAHIPSPVVRFEPATKN
jgi:hypothetical protein